MRLLDNKALTGVMSVGSCCGSIQTPKAALRKWGLRAIYRPLDG
jgi:hypothetical protein